MPLHAQGLMIGFSTATPIGSIGVRGVPGARSAAMLFAGVFPGSAACWLLLAGLVSMARERLGARALALWSATGGDS